ncbi:hypothetical protein [Thermomonas sp.]|uniref:hypothetical protein n=1 Tax=Thermomonas sp. TaxID=1971895 RepID=UPI0024888967|nr:hypothetical protein [Thermomonas sp.]MDI1253292.1 hypothetical protein [Thermomonas sp.]
MTQWAASSKATLKTCCDGFVGAYWRAFATPLDMGLRERPPVSPTWLATGDRGLDMVE